MPNEKSLLWRGAFVLGLLVLLVLGYAFCQRSRGRKEKPWTEFSGEKALAHVQALVDFGPRPPGSSAIEATRAYLKKNLQTCGWRLEEQRFTEETPRGPVAFVNLIARWPEQKARNEKRFLVCSHYDTKTFDTIRFVGANDGGSSSGALLELGRVLSRYPRLAEKVALVFFDGEEAYENFTETDGLYGSRYFAQQLRESGHENDYRGGILWDMIGARSLTITLPPDSPAELARGIFQAAEALQERSHFTYLSRGILDDHSPLNRVGIPVIDLIDFDYPPWHTAADTMDQLDAESLRAVGAVTIYYLCEVGLK